MIERVTGYYILILWDVWILLCTNYVCIFGTFRPHYQEVRFCWTMQNAMDSMLPGPWTVPTRPECYQERTLVYAHYMALQEFDLVVKLALAIVSLFVSF